MLGYTLYGVVEFIITGTLAPVVCSLRSPAGTDLCEPFSKELMSNQGVSLAALPEGLRYINAFSSVCKAY